MIKDNPDETRSPTLRDTFKRALCLTFLGGEPLNTKKKKQRERLRKIIRRTPEDIKREIALGDPTFE